MILLLIFLATISLIFLLRKRRKNEPFNPPPGPKGLPIIGNLHQFDPSKPHIYFAKLAKIHGPILTTRFGSAPAVVVQSAKTAKEVLHTQDLNFCYRPSMIATQRLSYKGLDLAFAHSYAYFREIKKICVVHLLSSKRVESFTPIRQEEILRMVNMISTQISSGLETVNLSELLMSFASSNICRIAFGKRKRRKNEPFNPPPGPKGLPIIGNLHQFNPSKPHIYFAKLAKIYGPILTTRFGSTPAVVVQSAKTAKEVLHTQDINFCYRPSTIATQRLSYKGLDITFAQSYGYFREIKKICVVHLFSSKRVESFTPIRQEEVLRMVNKISTQISSSSGLEIVNLSELLMSFASSNICRIAFGKRYGENEGSNRSRFHNLLNDAQAMFTAFFFTDYFPSIGWLDKLTGQSSRLEKTFKDLDVFYDEIINDHLDPNRPVSETEDIIDVLLHLRKERAFTFDLSLDHIKGVLMNMFVAGTDTSAAMVVWAMTELIKNPTAMKKVQKELRGLAGNKGYVSADDLPKLEYFKAVIKETLRFRPAAPVLIVRETLEKCTIEGYDILPKTLVFVNAWTIGRDTEYWKDPEVFMPERFMGSSIDYKGQDFEFIPFGAGRKMCPGMLLGVANFELALANLLFSFDWELPDGIKMEDIDTDTLPGVTMHKKNPLCLVARKYT